jgi:hypothetical protein
VSSSPRAAVRSATRRPLRQPVGEQRALAAGEAIVDSPTATCSRHRRGPAELARLPDLAAPDRARARRSAETLLLDPSGASSTRAGARRRRPPGCCSTPARARALLAFLDRMRFMLRVEVADRSAEFATVGSLGDCRRSRGGAARHPARLARPVAAVVAGGHQYATTPATPGRLALQRDAGRALPPRRARSRCPPAGTLALEALRIAAWRRAPRPRSMPPRSRTSSTGCGRPCTSPRGCYRGPGDRREGAQPRHPPRGWSCCTSTAPTACCPPRATRVGRRDGRRPRDGRRAPSRARADRARRDQAQRRPRRDPHRRDRGRHVVAAAQELVVPPDAGAEADIPKLPRLGAVKR